MSWSRNLAYKKAKYLDKNNDISNLKVISKFNLIPVSECKE
jgi:hypothetical protein